ncbi:MAG: glycosyltransferase [Pyrinomonadaceae bacterium]|nr:glycosyltransferase [Pyrinomonadaceae bacterium]
MSDKLLISVCMITFNHAPFIAQAIEGVLSQQTSFEVELVIGEDFSSDETRQICEDYQSKHPKQIKLLETRGNLGMMPNFIRTLKSCRGRYIALCEGDDFWTDSSKLQKQVDFLEANADFAISFHNVEIKYEDNTRKNVAGNVDQKAVSVFEDLALRNFIHTASCVFRNHNSDFPAWFVKMHVGDWTLHLINAEHGKIGYINEVMAVYRIHQGGVWASKKHQETLLKWIPIVEQCRQHFYPRGNDEFNSQLVHNHSELCFNCFDSKNYEQYRKSYHFCLKHAGLLSRRTMFALTTRYLMTYFPPLAIYYNKQIGKNVG